MKQSLLFSKTSKDSPKDEVSKNAILLMRAGFVHKEMAGVYSYLPLGLRVINKIKKIANEEMERIGSIEILMSTLQEKALWEKTDRWSDDAVDIWFKSKLKNGSDIGFGWSHEEPITAMMSKHITSYKDLPIVVHQFQNKLRNEVRAKSGVMRGREFIMKDMYSYATSEQEHMDFYNKSIEAYTRVYEHLGLGDITYVTSASGGVFTDKFSHEFQTLCEAGEDTIFVHESKKLAINEEVFTDETLATLGEERASFSPRTAAEVGNIFTFGIDKTKAFDASYKTAAGVEEYAYLGSYGIGISRVMGVVAEVFSDDRGIIWPESIAPFQAHIISLGADTEASELYSMMLAAGIEVLLDDREAGAGSKLADADLIGIPYRIVVSPKSLAAGGFEVKKRVDSTAHILTSEALMSILLAKKDNSKHN
jgi:prolyl-tRNA synthetase